jgi:CHAD domain-containing protein
MMKNSACFINYYRSLDKKFEKHFHASLKKDKAENIHALRVTIKKMKAFFHLINYLDDRFHFEKTFHDFKKIFHEAGKVRDLHVQSVFLDTIEKEINMPLIKQRNELIRKETGTFIAYRKRTESRQGFNHDIKRKVFRHSRKNFNLDRIKLYLIAQGEKINEQMNKPDHTYLALHKLRIHLKRYCYNLMLVNSCSLKNKSIEKHIRRLEHLQDQLGKLHDSVIILSLTKKIGAGRNFSKNDIKSIWLLNVRMEKSNEKKASEIRRHFSPFIKEFETMKRRLLKHGKKMDLR